MYVYIYVRDANQRYLVTALVLTGAPTTTKTTTPSPTTLTTPTALPYIRFWSPDLGTPTTLTTATTTPSPTTTTTLTELVFGPRASKHQQH